MTCDLGQISPFILLSNAMIAFLLNVAAVFLVGVGSGLILTLAGVFKARHTMYCLLYWILILFPPGHPSHHRVRVYLWHSDLAVAGLRYVHSDIIWLSLSDPSICRLQHRPWWTCAVQDDRWQIDAMF
jgi:hypothetical protein